MSLPLAVFCRGKEACLVGWEIIAFITDILIEMVIRTHLGTAFFAPMSFGCCLRLCRVETD
jgi:hypothetical protein